MTKDGDELFPQLGGLLFEVELGFDGGAGSVGGCARLDQLPFITATLGSLEHRHTGEKQSTVF